MHSGWKRDAVLLLGSRLVSLFGSSQVQYAIMWHITLLRDLPGHAGSGASVHDWPPYFHDMLEGFPNKVHSMALSAVAVALGTMALGVIRMFWLYAAIMTLMGFAIPMFNTPATVLLQQRVDPGFLGCSWLQALRCWRRESLCSGTGHSWRRGCWWGTDHEPQRGGARMVD